MPCSLAPLGYASYQLLGMKGTSENLSSTTCSSSVSSASVMNMKQPPAPTFFFNFCWLSFFVCNKQLPAAQQQQQKQPTPTRGSSSFHRSVFLGILIFLSFVSKPIVECHVHSDYEEPDPFMDPTELESLFEVMEALNNDIEWRRHYPHPCSSTPWPGIRCEQQDDGLSHVTRIDFGSLPNSTCKQNASMSPSLLRLRSLRSLFILNCFVGTNTTILPGIAKLAPSLQMLSLRGNTALVGEIPAEIGHLSKLEIFSLSQNGLSGGIPKALGILGRIQNLDLSYNKLEGSIPSELGSLKSLTILGLNGNRLSGSIPSSLGSLSGLQKMDLSNNRLRGNIPSSIGNMDNLKFLALSENMLSGGVPTSFVNLTSLEYLIIHSNPMNVELPDFWLSLSNLSELSLSNSGYFGAIPPSLGELLYLSELSLEHNHLNGTIPSSLGSLPNIYHLNLSENLLTGSVPFTKDFLYRLGENLDLRGNLDLCLSVVIPKNVSTKNLSSCSSSSASMSSSHGLLSLLDCRCLLPVISTAMYLLQA